MPDYTAMEKKAVAAARVVLWDELVAVCDGDQDAPLCIAFAVCSEGQIDRIISAVWDGLRASMQKQSATGAIPF
jgi:hypothetical protein